MNKKTIIDIAIREVNSNRLNSEIKAEQNYKLARQKSADFFKLDNAFREKTMLFGQSDTKEENAKKLMNEIEKIKKARLSALSKIGMTEQDITPKYECLKCNDNGFIDGKICQCLKRKIHTKLLEYSGLSGFKGHRFSECDLNILKENTMLDKAYTLAKTYVQKFPDVKTPNLIFMGEVGIGKSFLLECIANDLLEKQFFVVYVTAFGLSNTMLKALTLPPAESEAILSPLIECDLLIIDDLGSEPMFKNLSTSNLFTILNEREVKNLPILISTNLDFEKLEERYGNRLFSRIFNQRKSKVITFKGVDLRIKK